MYSQFSCKRGIKNLRRYSTRKMDSNVEEAERMHDDLKRSPLLVPDPTRAWAASPPAAAAPAPAAPSCAPLSDEKTDESEASSSLACGVTPANADASIAVQSPPISEPKRRSICGSTGSTEGSCARAGRRWGKGRSEGQSLMGDV